MNQRGIAIAFLPILLFIIALILVTAISFTFLKNIIGALILGVAGGVLIYLAAPRIEKKVGQGLLVGGLVLLLLGLFVGVAQPFDVYGQEVKASYYEGSKASFFVAFQDFKRSFLSNETANLTIVNNGISYWGGASGSIGYPCQVIPGVGMRCGSYINGINASFSNYKFSVYLDDKLVSKDNGDMSAKSIYVATETDSSCFYDSRSYFVNPFNGSSNLGGATEPFFIKTNCAQSYAKQNVAINFSSVPEIKGGLHKLKVYAYPTQLNAATYPALETNLYTGDLKTNVLNAVIGNASAASLMTSQRQNNCVYSYQCDVLKLDLINALGVEESKKILAFEGDIYLEAPECANSSSYVTKMITVTGGDVITRTPTVGQIGLPSDAILCHTLPVLKQVSGVTFEQDISPYQELEKGNPVTVPSGQNWILFYKETPKPEERLLCEDGSVYDALNNKCVLQPAIIYECVSGVFDAERKLCVVQPGIKNYCTQGVLNASTGKCEIEITDLVYTCPQGYTLSGEKCIGTPEEIEEITIPAVPKEGVLVIVLQAGVALAAVILGAGWLLSKKKRK